MSGGGDAPPAIEARLSAICLALPEAYEEPAWVGTRWRVRMRTFAHVYAVDRSSAAAYVRAAGVSGPACLLTMRCEDTERTALIGSGLPFFAVDWGSDVLGVVLDEQTDWSELAELLTESFCRLAPAKLVARIDRPP